MEDIPLTDNWYNIVFAQGCGDSGEITFNCQPMGTDYIHCSWSNCPTPPLTLVCTSDGGESPACGGDIMKSSLESIGNHDYSGMISGNTYTFMLLNSTSQPVVPNQVVTCC